MTETAQRVEDANQNPEKMVQSMKDVNGSSERTSKRNRVIDEIVFQTNIMALNAAVEAACAGEAGMGFAGFAGPSIQQVTGSATQRKVLANEVDVGSQGNRAASNGLPRR